MSDKATILVQLDTDPHPSVFDRVVAIDAGVVGPAIRGHIPGARVDAVGVSSSADGPRALDGRNLVVAAGAAGQTLLPRRVRDTCRSLRLAIDLNGVPPEGIEGVEMIDKGADRGGGICYGALGVRGTQMKIHKAATVRLFGVNNPVPDIGGSYDNGLTPPPVA